MERKQQFFEWLIKERGYAHGSADAAVGRLAAVKNAIGKDFYVLSPGEADTIREDVLGKRICSYLGDKERNELGTSLARYSDFATIFPLISNI